MMNLILQYEDGKSTLRDGNHNLLADDFKWELRNGVAVVTIPGLDVTIVQRSAPANAPDMPDSEMTELARQRKEDIEGTGGGKFQDSGFRDRIDRAEGGSVG